jgi:hypothetical protein
MILRRQQILSERFTSGLSAVDANQTYNQQALVDQLLNTQSTNSGLMSHLSQDLMNRYAAQNSIPQRNLLSFASGNNGTLSGSGRFDASTGGDASTSMYGAARHPNLSVAELTQQQRQRDFSILQNNDNLANLAGAMANNRDLAVGSTAMTRNLLRILQDRQAAAATGSVAATNLTNAETILLQQQQQQQPPGASNDGSHRR